ncbi:MAG TPA: superoxide dismutase, Ni [Candidatus Saccharimonadales bacterium]|jgi:nickel superoxide dismutase
MSIFNSTLINIRRFDLSARPGEHEARSKAYWLIRRASTGALNAVSRQKQYWASGFARWQRTAIKPVWAHCDLPCGVYDPEQARIEAKSIVGINTKYPDLSQEDKWRAIRIKEDRAELVKHHLWVLWTDYFKPEHLDKHPVLHDLFWQATKQAGLVKKTTEVQEAKKLLEMIDQIDVIFKETKK